MRDVHWCITVFYQQIENGNIANQIHEFTIDYSKFMLIYAGKHLLVVVRCVTSCKRGKRTQAKYWLVFRPWTILFLIRPQYIFLFLSH